MTDTDTTAKQAGPKYPFYRNKAGGGIYPAMASPPGYEDKHPDDWEPCTDEEIAAERKKLKDLRDAAKALRDPDSDDAVAAARETIARAEAREAAKQPKPKQPTKAELKAAADAASATGAGGPAADAAAADAAATTTPPAVTAGPVFPGAKA